MDLLGLAQYFKSFEKFFAFITDKGILVRTGTVAVGIVMVILGVGLLFRKPVTEAVSTVAGVASKVPV